MPSVDLQKVGDGAAPDPGNSNAVGIGFNQTRNLLSINNGGTFYEVAVDGGLRMKETTITAAQIALLRATPITVVPAPGAGKMNVFHSAVILLDYVAPAFTETSDNLLFKYTDGSGTAVSEIVEMTSFIDLTADNMTFAVPDGGAATVIATKTQSENSVIVLHNNGDGEFGGSGGSALRVKVWYSVVSTGW